MTQETAFKTVDASELGNAFGQFATGVTVVTTQGTDGSPCGAMVTAFAAVSLDPPLAQITLARTVKAAKYLEGSSFAINILSIDQLETAKHFAGQPSGSEPEWTHAGEAPELLGNAATLRCRPWDAYDGGDHIIVVGEVRSLTVNGADPLLFHEGKFCSIGDQIENHLDNGWFPGVASFQPFSPKSN